MKRLLAAAVVVLLSACPATPTGTTGADGAPGAAGPTGAMGMTGPAGTMGPAGVTGAAGAIGPTGPTGPQGPKGDQGQVLVLDGGVVTGPRGPQGVTGPTGPAGAMGAMGPGVTATPVAAGNATCPTGGLKVTQASDGGVTYLCNGVAGPAGATGATGPQGAMGLQGLAGPQGATGAPGAVGATGQQGPAGTTGPQGPQGSIGPAGATGAAGGIGPQGVMGPQGPPGLAGAVLYLDGGYALISDKPQFAGFTGSTWLGNFGGSVVAHGLCAASFPGAHFCQVVEYGKTNSAASVPATGAWIDGVDVTTMVRTPYCSGWSNATSSPLAFVLRPDGSASTQDRTSTYFSCATARPLACCASPAPTNFRGFTPAAAMGDFGGTVFGHQLCAAAFPGSHFCHVAEYQLANSGAAIPAAGAWIDGYDAAKQLRLPYCTGWTNNTGSPLAYVLRPDGSAATQDKTGTYFSCATARSLACCE